MNITRSFTNPTSAAISAENFAEIVLYEDNHLLVVVKPAGLLSQGDASGRPNMLDLARDYIRIKYRKPGRAWLGLVHRLDRLVGGVMVFARTSKAASRLSAQIREHRFRKTYIAVIQGKIEPDIGESTMYLARAERLTEVAGKSAPGAKKAVLAYKTVESGLRRSLLEIDLKTGRKHQIRAQLTALGHPILGDALYGSDVFSVNDSIALYSSQLEIRHPISGDGLIFEAAPPEDWPWLPLSRRL